jgi:CBS domain-containing protein
MVRRPKTLPAPSSVDDARAALADDHVHMVLLTEGRTLRGTVLRTDLPPEAPGTDAALRWSSLPGRTVAPHVSAEVVHELMVGRGLRRLAVVDPDRTLLGLVCLKRTRSGFCSDADVASRAATGRRRMMEESS